MQASVLLSIGNHVEADLYCSILYQRGVYPSEDFEQQKQYGLTMMVSTEPGIKKYLCSVLEQMAGALLFSFSLC